MKLVQIRRNTLQIDHKELKKIVRDVARKHGGLDPSVIPDDKLDVTFAIDGGQVTGVYVEWIE